MHASRRAVPRLPNCAFFPATELQVQRLTMQRRIFTVEGKRYLVSRDGSYFETAGTLRALIDKVVLHRVGGAKGFPDPPLDLEVPPSPRAERVLVSRGADSSPVTSDSAPVSIAKES